MSEQVPRWFTAFGEGHAQWYIDRFAGLAADGADLEGEARLVDALIARGSRILDAGCGPGRTGAALHARGHTVVGVDVDAALVEAARSGHPGPRWLVGDLAELTLDDLRDPDAASDLGDPDAASELGDPDAAVGELFDAVVLAGNVMVFLAPGSEAQVMRRVTALLRPGGVVVVGFNTEHPYTLDQFDRDWAAAGLRLEHRFATWDLRPWAEHTDWAVTVLRRPEPAAPAQ